jgi:predicted enzyme related to lactoylglutathione lyase
MRKQTRPKSKFEARIGEDFMSEDASEIPGMAGPQPGTFCWTEIATTGANESKEFFKNVFGWEFKESDAGGMEYNEFTIGRDYPAGGLYELNPDWFDGHPPPPHFMTYIAVDNADENAQRATELGGKVKKIQDIPGVGRVAIIEDPTGAVFATYQMLEGGHHG